MGCIIGYSFLLMSSSLFWASLVAQMKKHLPAMQETQVQSLGQEDPLEKQMATHSSILAWRLPWTEEPGGLQSTGLQRVRHNWVTKYSSLFYKQMESPSFSLKDIWTSGPVWALNKNICSDPTLKSFENWILLLLRFCLLSILFRVLPPLVSSPGKS